MESESIRGMRGLHGEYGLGEANIDDKTILKFSSTFYITIVNTCFMKQKEYLILPSFQNIYTRVGCHALKLISF